MVYMGLFCLSVANFTDTITSLALSFRSSTSIDNDYTMDMVSKETYIDPKETYIDPKETYI